MQSQSITVDQQMKRYKVPSLVFINKCDRSGANPDRVVAQLKDKLGHNPVVLQLPIGLEAEFEGVVDLITMKALYFDGENGETVRIDKIPAHLQEEAEARRETLLETATMFCDELMEAVLEESEIPSELLLNAIRKGTLSRSITPVLLGSAYKNKGIQPLLDAVNALLPCPADVVNEAHDLRDPEQLIRLVPEMDKPTVSLAFKLEDGQYGQLTYIRVYQGALRKGDTVINVRTGNKIKIGRLVRMHASQKEDIDMIPAGFIGALFGVECASGDSFVSSGLNLAMTSMFVPEPVISLAVVPKDNKAEINMAKALNRFTKEDPTFRTYVSEETGDTIISGMGELHLEVYIERMKREYQAEVTTGAPRVAYRETITQKAEFNYTHKKQTGGAGQFGRIAGFMEPVADEDFVFENKITGGSIPTQFIPACEKGFLSCMKKGPKLGFPVTGVKICINDGASHSVDSSDMAFQAAARGAFSEVFQRAKPVIQEPVMKVVVETPTEFQGNVMGALNQRRGMIVGTQDEGLMCAVEAQIPLAEMFGFSTVLRSLSQGKAQFTMEFSSYRQVPQSIAEEVAKKIQEEKSNVA